MATAKRKYGWLPDLPDHRDHRFELPSDLLQHLPHSIDLRPHCPEVLDQGQKIGSCTANAVCNAYRFDLMKQGATKKFSPSRLFIHYNARAMIGTQKQNHGAHVRDAIKSVVKQGVCHEKTWPYIAKKYAHKPPRAAYEEALEHQALSYQRLRHEVAQLKACLAEGYPFVFGLTTYEDFESDRVTRTGTVHLPKKSESLIGGHTVLAVGYNDDTQRFTVMNSWGKTWGKAGYFTLPYHYLAHEDLAADFWVIRSIET